MAEDKKERKPKNNFKVHLTGNKYIIGDSQCYWIASETIRHKDGNEIPVQTRLSGYHSDFVSLFDSYFQSEIKHAEIEGELADLAELVKKTRAEIKRWFTRLDKAVDWSDGQSEIKHDEIEGKLADLTELVRKTRAEIKKLFTRLGKDVDWSDGK